MITIPQLRILAAERAGIERFDGSLADLSPTLRERLIDAMAVIVSERPSDFNRQTQEFAVKRINSEFFGEPIRDFGPLDAVRTFADEFGNQAKDVITLKQPLVRAVVFLGFGVLAVVVFNQAVQAARILKSE